MRYRPETHVPCPTCGAAPFQCCRTVNGGQRRPHAARQLPATLGTLTAEPQPLSGFDIRDAAEAEEFAGHQTECGDTP